MNQTTTIILSLLLALAGNLTLTRNAYARHQDLKQQQQSAQAEFEQNQAIVAQLPSLRSQDQQAQIDLTTLQSKFPAEENLGILINNLQEAAQASHLNLNSINRQVSASPIPGFNQVDLTLLMDGNYPATVRFLKWAHDNKRILNVTSYQGNNDEHQTVNVTGYVHTPLPGEGANP